MAELVTKAGDSYPLPRYQLLDGDSAPVSLVGATVVQRFSGAPASGSPCEVDGDAADGIVRLASRQHLPTPTPGRSVTVSFETEVTYQDGTVQTFPTAGYDRWTVWADLDEVEA